MTPPAPPTAPESAPDPATDLHQEPTGPLYPALDAIQAADAAAHAADVHVRELSTLADLDTAYRLFDTIWRPDPNNPPITSELLRALTKAGSYVSGAFDDEKLLGACVGFFSAPAAAAVHSHIAGVSSAAQGRSVGFALKVHQRAWAIQRGVSTVSWTFDPLVRRNAYFNLVKLAAKPQEYLTNFYGSMHDAINGGDDSDRLLVRWELNSPAVADACRGIPYRVDAGLDGLAVGADGANGAGGAAAAAVALSASDLGAPVLGTADAPTVLVAVPADVEALRLSDPGSAKDWRLAVREALTSLLAEGCTLTGFDRAGRYVLQRPEQDEPAPSEQQTPTEKDTP